MVNKGLSSYLDFHRYFGHYNNTSYERTKNWFFIGTSYPMVYCLMFYVILVAIIGPSFMKNRKPYNLTNTIRAYNIFQVFACLYLLYEYFSGGFTLKYVYICVKSEYHSTDPQVLRTATAVYLNFFLRFIELIETVFFVLRKKQNQITFLHVYHHVSTLMLMYLEAKYIGGGAALLAIVLNNVVHVNMYLYYFLSSFGAEFQKKIQFLKRSITQMQIVQFLIIIALAYNYIKKNCLDGLHKDFVYVFVFDIVVLLYLFSEFYVRAYWVKKTRRQTEAANDTKVIK